MTLTRRLDESSRIAGVLDVLVAGSLIATTAALPLLFVPGLDDGYALPKAVLLRVAATGIGAAIVAYLLLGGPLRIDLDRWIDTSIATFAALTVASTIASVDIGQSVFGEPYQYQGVVTVLLYIGGFYAARQAIRSIDRFEALTKTHIVVGGIVAMYAVAQTIDLDPFWSGPPEDRAISSVGQANDLAAYLDIVIVLGLGLWGSSRAGTRIAIAVVTALCGIGLALTLSRAGFVTLAAVGVLTLWFSWPMLAKRRLSPKIVALVVVALVAIGATAGPSIVRVADRAATTADLQEGSVRMHLDSWRVGLAIASDRPLLGTGPETFPLVFSRYLDGNLPPDRAEFLRRFRLESPHNEWIGVAAESGIPALVAYLVFLGALALRLASRARTRTSAASRIAFAGLGVLVVHVVTTGFKTPETSTSLLFWVVVGAALAASGSAEERDQTVTGSPALATSSIRSAARTVPDVDLIRADIAARRSAKARSLRSRSIAPVSSSSSKP